MYAMQYEITLPADYDMDIIRDRVATKGHLLDELPGLGIKAYGVRCADGDSAVANQYAPFYLWTDPAAMSRFLWGGGGFAGIIKSFGRPQVQHWTGVDFKLGPAAESIPIEAVKDVTTLGPDQLPEEAITEAMDRSSSTLAKPETHSVAIAVDPLRWQLVEYALFASPQPRSTGQTYQVLHFSRPGLRDLKGERAVTRH
jgi:uncharacterized protein DUF4865